MSVRMAAMRGLLRVLVRRGAARQSIEAMTKNRMPEPPEEITARHRCEAMDVGAASAVWLDREAAPGGVLAYLHGGSRVSGPTASQWRYFARLCEETGVAGILLRYRLAPEHPYPAALDDGVSLAESLAGQGLRWALVGDSAGASIGLAVTCRLRDTGRPGPVALSLVSPFLDLTLEQPGLERLERRDPLLTIPPMKRTVEAYLAGADPRDPYISPLFGELDGLPPVQLIVGDRELGLIDAHRLRDRLSEIGAELDYLEERGGYHGYPLSRHVPEARTAIARQARFLGSHLRAEALEPTPE